MDDNLLKVIRGYYETSILGILKQYVRDEDIIVVIGGSYSYGFNDAFSDVDVFVIIDMDEETWFKDIFKMLTPFMFNHKEIEGFRIQYVPLILSYQGNLELKNVLNGDAIDDLSNEFLYNISKYIPVYPCLKIDRIQRKMQKLDDDFWNKRCRRQALQHVDVLEQFYGNLKRNDIRSQMLNIGSVISGSLELAYLSQNRFYPPKKWLWKGLKLYDAVLYDELSDALPVMIFDDIDCLRKSIKALTDIVCRMLDGKVEEHVIDALKNP